MRLNRKVNDLVTIQQRVLNVKRLLHGQSSVMLRIDDHIFFLIRYAVQGDLFSFVVGGEQIVQCYDCHIFAGVFRWDGVLITGVGDEAVFLYPAQVNFIDDIFVDIPARRSRLSGEG